MEICDPIEKKQVVHLILAEGGTNCEIVRHMPKDCVPSKENDHPIMPQKATFKELLLSKNHSMAALEDTIKKTVTFLKNSTSDFQINNSLPIWNNIITILWGVSKPAVVFELP